jgi:hypothetical protein
MPDLKPLNKQVVEEVTLNEIQYGLSGHLGRYALDEMRLELLRDMMSGGFIAQLRTAVLAKSLPPQKVSKSVDVVFEFPSSPFQHWKMKHQGSWWLRRFVRWRPVKRDRRVRVVTLAVNLKRYRTFPEANFRPEPGSRFGALMVRQHHIDASMEVK